MKVEGIRIVIADDNATMRKGIRGLLEKTPGIIVVGEASNGLEAIELVEKLSPQVVILDIEMPVMDGITALITIKQKGGNMPILILSASDNIFTVMKCIEGGAHGYVLKDEAPDFLAVQYSGPRRAKTAKIVPG